MKSMEHAKLLSIFHQFVAGLSDSQLKKLLDGQGKLKIAISNDQIAARTEITNDCIESQSTILALLNELPTRQSGYLALEPHTKNDLLIVARHLDIPVDRSSNKSQLIEKIVERTVGMKLRRTAIDTLATH
jgi:hypothetical protein